MGAPGEFFRVPSRSRRPSSSQLYGWAEASELAHSRSSSIRPKRSPRSSGLFDFRRSGRGPRNWPANACRENGIVEL